MSSPAPLPPDEQERLAALARLGVLDTPPEAEFDDLAALAAAALDTPIALVSLVDRERQWFKANVGLAATETPRDVAFCAHAILGAEVFVVEDATLDARFRGNPLVTDDPSIRFYAGAPVTAGGRRVGTLCVIDTKPRKVTPRQREVLESLARTVGERLDSRATIAGLHDEIHARAEVEERLRSAWAAQPPSLQESLTGRVRPSRSAVAGLITVGLLLLTVTWLLYRHERRQMAMTERARFERNVAFGIDAISRRASIYAHLLAAVRAYVLAQGGDLTRAEWQQYNASLDIANTYAGIMGIGFIEYVPAEKLDAFLARARGEDPLLRVHPGGARSDYFVIRHLEPLQPNRGAIGYDIGSEVRRRSAAERAAKTGLATMTDPIVLVQDRESQPGFLMLLPVERPRGQLAGWVYVAVRYPDLLASLRPAHGDETAVTLRSGSDRNLLVYSDGKHPDGNDLKIQRRLDLYGSSIEATYVPTRALLTPAERRQPVLITIGGAVISIAIVIGLWLLAATRARALVIARGMTEALVKSEQKMRELVENIADGVIAVDDELHVASVNPAAVAIFGYPPAGIVGRKATVLLPDFRPDMLRAGSAELRGLTREGKERLVELTWGPSHGAGEGAVLMARDVTDRRRVEREMQVVQAIAARAGTARDEAELYEDVLPELCAWVDHPYGEVWVPQGERLVRRTAWFHASDALIEFDRCSTEIEFPRGMGLPGVVWARGEAYVAADLAADPLFHRPAEALAAGLRSAFAVPVTTEGDVLAVLLFMTDSASAAIDQRHVKVLRTIGGQLAEAIRSIRAETALKESEERYRDLFENATDLIQAVGPDGTFIYVNDAWVRTLGYSRADAASLTLFDVIAPDQHQHCQAMFEQLMAGHEVGRVETVFVTASGESRLVEGTVSCRRREGIPVSTRSIFRDVTDERAAQAAVARSRDQLRAVLDAATEVSIIGTDPHGVITEFNTGAERLLGYESAEMIGCTPVVFHDPEEVALRGAALTHALGRRVEGFDVFVEVARGGDSEEREWTYIRKDGERRAISLVVTAIRSGSEEIAGFVGVARDVTATRQAEASLRASREALQSLMENSLDGIVTFGHDGRIEMVNPAAARILGYAPEELAGESLAKLVPNDVADVHAFLREKHREALGRVSEVSVRTKSGANLAIELALFEFRTTGGRRFAGMIQDLTERKEVERMKKEFVSTVSHELRTPLTSIRGALDLLSGGVFGAIPEDAQEVVRIAHKNSTRLISLINDILDLDRLDSGRLEMVMAETEVTEVVHSAVESVRAFADQQRVRIVSDVSPVKVIADEGRIVQVLVNLLSNAVKFSTQGTSVRVEVSEQDAFVTVRVVDEGRGIPARFLEKIFGRFQQVDSTDSRTKGGSGLGLAISRAIVEQHGGTIGVESEEGCGSTFWFRLPSPVRRRLAEGNGGRKVIVVQCGENLPMQLLGELSRSEAFEIVTAASAAEFLHIMRTAPVALAIVDTSASLSRETIGAIDGCIDCRDVPMIIVASGIAATQLPIRGNVSLFLVDVLDPDQLVNTIRSIVGAGGAGHVLVVEDDEELLRVITTQLTSEGIVVDAVCTVTEALAAARRKRPALLVLDVGLPDGDGFGVIRELHGDVAFREMSVLVYTGRYLDADERKRLTLGQTRFLTKAQASDEEFRNVVLSMLADAQRTS